MDDPLIATLLLFVVALVYGGSTLLLTWYHRSYLGRHPGPAAWILPSLAAVGVVVAIAIGMIGATLWAFSAVGILVVTAALRFMLFHRGQDEDPPVQKGTGRGHGAHGSGSR